MNVQGTYWIGNIDITCECGYNCHYILEEDNFPFESEGDYENIWACPECGKKININYFVDDSLTEDINFEEIESDGDENETD